MRKLLCTLAAAALVALFAGTAMAGELSMPSSKASYMYGNIQLMTEAAVEAVFEGNNITDIDSNTQAVMTVFLKTANQSEIAMDLSLVCALWNENVASSKGGKKETSTTGNVLTIRIEVDSFKTNGDFIKSPEVIPEEVVYCKQDLEVSATFQGIFTTSDAGTGSVWEVTTDFGDDDGLVGSPSGALFADLESCQEAGDAGDDGVGGDQNTCQEITNVTFLNTCLVIKDGRIVLVEECLTPEEVAVLLHTTHANAFNWLALDVPAGVQRITVTADIESEAEVAIEDEGGFADDSTTSALARALLDNMALFAEEVRLVKDSVVTCDNNDGNPLLWCSAADFDEDDIHDFVDNDDDDDGILDVDENEGCVFDPNPACGT